MISISRAFSPPKEILSTNITSSSSPEVCPSPYSLTVPTLNFACPSPPTISLSPTNTHRFVRALVPILLSRSEQRQTPPLPLNMKQKGNPNRCSGRKGSRKNSAVEFQFRKSRNKFESVLVV